MFRKPVKQKGKEAKEKGFDITMLDRYKKAFVSYNIDRIREIISRLSPEMYDLFHTLPFLIHVNGPKFPGYIDHPISAYGIYSFQDSGFWTEALKHFKIKEKELLPHLAGTHIIKGLYLKGSVGSLVQGGRQGFNYWVVVDEKKTIDIHHSLLQRKLAKISDWSLKEYNRKINFIVLKDGQVRHNMVSSGGQGRSWPEQKTIFKEEFYRTFVMIAGLIPVWAVLPSGLNNEDYIRYVDQVLEKNSGLSADSLYIDLGNPGPINKSECPGAILRQLYKAKDDPVTSLVSASLAASYYYEDNGPLPCDKVKETYMESELTECVTFPDTVVFDRILKFYQKRAVGKMVELIKKAIYLMGYRYALFEQHGVDTPFAGLLSRLESQWEWGNDKTGHLKQHDEWPEAMKLAQDEMIIERIGELYRDVVISMTRGGHMLPGHHLELQLVKNNISALFQKKKNKISMCSAYLRAKAGAGHLKILCRRDMETEKQWSCHEYGSNDCQYDESHAVYRACDPLEVVGWIIANRLAGNNVEDAVIFEEQTGSHVAHVSKLFERAHSFLFEPDDCSTGIFREDPAYDRVFISVNSKPDDELLEDAGMLIRNSWKEIFYIPLDIKHIENMMLQCYKIGKVISNFYQKATSRNLQYAVFHNTTDNRGYVYRTVREFASRLRHDRSEPLKTNRTEANSHEPEDRKPFLDTL